MLHTFYFSPSGTTKATVDILSGSIGTETVHHDMTADAGQFTVDSPDDVVYGNRDYDDGDRKRIIEFARLVNDAFSRDRILDVSHVKGNRPYRVVYSVGS